jgi:hypothetical protein
MTIEKTPAEQHDEQIKMLQVFTTEQKPAEKEEIVFATARNGKNEDGTKREVDNANRYRCIVIPELSIDGVPSKFHSLCLQALRDVAKAQFTNIWQQNPQIREVQAAIWSVDSLLLYAARETESKRLTKENLATWFDASNLCKELMQAGDAKKLSNWKERICKLAAPTLDWGRDLCDLAILRLASDCDDENIIGKQLVAKLTARIDTLKRQLEEIAELE